MHSDLVTLCVSQSVFLVWSLPRHVVLRYSLYQYSTMKTISITSIFLLLSITVAHSWLHCTDHDNKDILEWMKGRTLRPAQFLLSRTDIVVQRNPIRLRQSHRPPDALVRQPLPWLAACKAKPW